MSPLERWIESVFLLRCAFFAKVIVQRPLVTGGASSIQVVVLSHSLNSIPEQEWFGRHHFFPFELLGKEESLEGLVTPFVDLLFPFEFGWILRA